MPIAVITLAGRRYIVSPTPARNCSKTCSPPRACTLRSRDSREPCRATRVTDRERVADVVSSYLALMNAPWAVAQFPFLPDATHTRIEQAAHDVAVFELAPTDSDT